MVIYVPICFALIGIVLLQKGKGVGFAGAFGLGAGSEAVFGPRGGVSLPVRVTQVLAGTFMVLALLLSLTGGLARRGIAPGTVEAMVDAETAVERTGLELLEDAGLGSAVGGGTTPAGDLTVLDELDAADNVDPLESPVLDPAAIEVEAEEPAEAAEETVEETPAAAEEAADEPAAEQPAAGS